MKTKNIATYRVKTDLEKPMDIDLVAEHIKYVAENFEKAMNSGITKRAIVILIADNIPNRSVGISEIEKVLDGAVALKRFLIKK